MDEVMEGLFEDNSTQFFYALEQLFEEYADTENISMPVEHAVPSEEFFTSSQLTAPQETPSVVSNYPPTAFAVHGEACNTAGSSEHSSVIPSFSTHKRFQLQGQNPFLQNYHQTEVERSNVFLPTTTIILSKFDVFPKAPIKDPNESYGTSASNSDVRVICQGFFKQHDRIQCPKREIWMDSIVERDQYQKSGTNDINAEKVKSFVRQYPADTGFGTPILVDPQPFKAACSDQIRANPKHLEMSGVISGTFEGLGAENSNHELNARSNVCTKSENEYCRKDELVPYQREMHVSKGILPLACEYCDETFLLTSQLARHVCVHTSNKRFVCEMCNRGFTGRDSLKSHLKLHSNEKPYVCPVCEKGFARKYYLEIHVRFHTKEKPYVCEMCNKGFSQGAHLKSHLRVHTKEKPYVCKVCNTRFSHKHHVKSHLRVYTKETPYVCKVCNTRFSRNDNLKVHLRVHTEEKP